MSNIFQKSILITGGAGFIGSHVVRYFVNNFPDYLIVNFDALTYAGNLENLISVEGADNYVFIKGNICKRSQLENVFTKYRISDVIHLAAESHVDRSIANPMTFVDTNILGTLTLLEVAREAWKHEYKDHRFYHISTDEVFGSLTSGYFTETTPYNPQSPYAASKAGSDHFVRAYANTYGLNIVISNCSNNYGPNQFPEKLIPLCIHNIINNKELPVYGDGKYTRDWLYVEDHADAIACIFHHGQLNETYAVGGFNEWQNIDLIQLLIEKMDAKLGRPKGASTALIHFIKDRPGHDRRYAIDASKLKQDLGWTPKDTFHTGLEKTIEWYLNNPDWLQNVTSGSYKSYYESHYQEV